MISALPEHFCPHGLECEAVQRHQIERGGEVMRNAMLAMLALLAAGAATMAGSGPAAAIDYPWCLQGRGWGIPGD